MYVYVSLCILFKLFVEFSILLFIVLTKLLLVLNAILTLFLLLFKIYAY